MNELERIKEEFKSKNSFQDLLAKNECTISLQSYDWFLEQTEKVKKYEKALEEITRQYDNTSVNRAKQIALGALGELSDEHKRNIQND